MPSPSSGPSPRSSHLAEWLAVPPPPAPPLTSITDREVVGRVLSGSTDEYALLVERHHARLARYALRMLANGQEAEEAVQDSFIRAYRSLAKCEDPERFG